MSIRKATAEDLSRIAEIYVFNNRVNYFLIFQDESFSFGELQVVPLADSYFGQDEVLRNLYVFDDGIIRGFIQIDGTEICKLYVDTFFQGKKIGARLLEYAVKEFHADHLWALEKNTRAVSFYQSHGFTPTGEKRFEEGTTEYLVKLVRKAVKLEEIETPEDIIEEELYMSKLKSMANIGDEMAKKLASVGIDTPEKLLEQGAKQAFFKLKEAYPQVCLVHLYALEGAIQNREFNSLSEEKKRELKEFSDFLKK